MNDRTRNIQAAIWLIGIGVLALSNQWWPGILVLVGISMVVGAFSTRCQRFNPSPPPVAPDWQSTPAEMPDNPAPEPMPVAAPVPEQPVYNLNWLPNTCPQCGAPLNVKGVQALDDRTAVCPFCSSKIHRG